MPEATLAILILGGLFHPSVGVIHGGGYQPQFLRPSRGDPCRSASRDGSISTRLTSCLPVMMTLTMPAPASPCTSVAAISDPADPLHVFLHFLGLLHDVTEPAGRPTFHLLGPLY